MPLQPFPLPFAAYQGGEPFAFVSYDHDDKHLVYPEMLALHRLGFNLWYDEGIPPGSDWTEEIADAVHRSSVVLFFVTPRSVTSTWCRKEVATAIENDRTLIAIHLEPSEMTKGLRFQLSNVQAILKYQMEAEHYERKLRDVIRLYLGGKEPKRAAGVLPVNLVAGPPSAPPAPRKKPVQWKRVSNSFSELLMDGYPVHEHLHFVKKASGPSFYLTEPRVIDPNPLAKSYPMPPLPITLSLAEWLQRWGSPPDRQTVTRLLACIGLRLPTAEQVRQALSQGVLPRISAPVWLRESPRGLLLTDGSIGFPESHFGSGRFQTRRTLVGVLESLSLADGSS